MQKESWPSEADSIEVRRDFEKKKYVHAYKADNYKMRKHRLEWFTSWANSVAHMFTEGDKYGMRYNSVLDVGAGRGQALQMLKKRGAKNIRGVEVIPEMVGDLDFMTLIDGAHDLPFSDNKFDLVMCLDVMEHLLEVDVEPVLSEIFRVAKKSIRLEISHRKDVGDGPYGHLHITVYPREWWLQKILKFMPNGARWTVEKDLPPKIHFHTRMSITLKEGYIK